MVPLTKITKILSIFMQYPQNNTSYALGGGNIVAINFGSYLSEL
jgi:hypothetical protein